MKLGIISALQEEQHGLVDSMSDRARVTHGMRDYWTGKLDKLEVVCVLSRIGKVAAATTATSLIEKFGVTHILFTGVAGSADEDIRVGDIVVAETLLQHDMDASPLFPRYEVPLTGKAHFSADSRMTTQLAQAASDFLENDFAAAVGESERRAFHLGSPRMHRGLIASGDQFVNQLAQIRAIKEALPAVLAVEMEGAAVAQVCFELGVPFAVIRTVSDNANENAATDFMRFVKSVAACYSYYIVRRFSQA